MPGSFKSVFWSIISLSIFSQHLLTAYMNSVKLMTVKNQVTKKRSWNPNFVENMYKLVK